MNAAPALTIAIHAQRAQTQQQTSRARATLGSLAREPPVSTSMSAFPARTTATQTLFAPTQWAVSRVLVNVASLDQGRAVRYQRVSLWTNAVMALTTATRMRIAQTSQ